ncbi:MAG: AsmA family protein [Caldimonas sp.]
MRNPMAGWRAGVRWPLILIALLVTLVVAIGICEAIGWPFLVGPVQRQLARTLDRRVVFGGDAGTGGDAASGVRIGLIGSVRVQAASIEIGAPSWSSAPHMLLARDARLVLGWFDLWRAWRGQPLHVRELEAASLDGSLERLADGRTSWQFGPVKPPAADEAATPLPTFGVLRVGDGHIAYNDALVPARIDARFALNDGGGPVNAAALASGASAPPPAKAPSDAGIAVRAGAAAPGASAVARPVALAAGESGLRLEAVGNYKKLPVSVALRTAGVLGFLAEGKEAQPQPLTLLARIGRAELTFQGSTTDPLHFAALTGRFTVAGPSLAAVGDALGITLPTTPAFKTRGTIVKDGKLWKAGFDDARIGSSQLNGAFTFDTRPKVPLLSGRLGGSRLLLADLGPAVGAAPAGAAPSASGTPDAGKRAGRVIPDKRFDLPSLRAMDANVVIEIGLFDPGTDVIEPLHPARAHLLLADGVLTLADFVGVTAQGKLLGYLQLDGRGDEALWTADMRLAGVDLARFLHLKRANNAPPYLSGKLDALVKVKGKGRSAAEILASLDGDLRMHMRGAAISHLAVEAVGLDVAQALGMMIKGDDALPIQCNVADLDIVKGVARPKVFVVNTKDSTVWIDGTVSLRDESLDLRAVVSPKDFSPFALRTPIRVRGTLGHPAVSVEMGKLAGKVGAAALLALLNPLAAIIPFIDTGSKDEAQRAGALCASLVRTSGVIPAAARPPRSTPMPGAASSGAAATAVRNSAPR